MRKLVQILVAITLASCATTKTCCAQDKDWKDGDFYKQVLRRATFYSAVTGNNSISAQNVYSVTNGLETTTIETPYDYSLAFGVRKIARLGYENRANTFYNGTERSYSDNATIGKISGFEFLFEADWRRQQGQQFFNQHHFLRYIADHWIVKTEYLSDGFADVEYFEASQRYRIKADRKLSFNIGIMQRISEPYGYNPLDQWLLPNGNIHYTQLAIEQGYTIDFDGLGGETYYDPNGNVVAENTEVWEAVVIPQMVSDYVAQERNKLTDQWNYSAVIGFDYYHFTKDFWLHSWGNLMPYHLDTDEEFSYHKFNDGQWIDWSGGLIFGYRITKSLGVFIEGKYNKYWNRSWHDFNVGLNYVIY